MIEFRNLRAQYQALKPDIDDAIAEVLEGGVYIGGQLVRVLEQQLAEYVGVKHCVTCGNGTDALQLALMAWGIRAGDAVFVPDFTFFSSGEVVSAVGATPVFVDVDAKTFNINPTKLEEAIHIVESEGRFAPRAVVAVDLFGLPADYPALREICDSHQLHLLEDGAQGFGGSIKNQMACSFGDISTTSFFPAKPLGCYGDGGAVFTDSDEWATLIRSYAMHGKGTMKYDNVRIGMNSRLDTMQAAILRVKLEAFIVGELQAVRTVADSYTKKLSGIDIRSGMTVPRVPEGFRSSWAQYTLRLKDRVQRDRLQTALSSEGIPSMVYYPKPMHKQKAFAGSNTASLIYYPVTERLCDTVLSLPCGPYITQDEIGRVIETIRNYLGV